MQFAVGSAVEIRMLFANFMQRSIPYHFCAHIYIYMSAGNRPPGEAASTSGNQLAARVCLVRFNSSGS